MTYKVGEYVELDITEYRSLGRGVIGLVLEMRIKEIDYCTEYFRNKNSLLLYFREGMNIDYNKIIEKIRVELNREMKDKSIMYGNSSIRY